MAGIFAIYKKKELDENKIELLNECSLKIKHRGRKHRYIYQKAPIEVIFYHKKVNNNKLPLNFSINDDNGEIIAIDGQIYNLDKLNHSLFEKKSIKKQEASDLQVILNGFTKIGKQLFHELNGSFSGIIFKGNELFGFKDPIGAKPLYYCENESVFVLSSELKSLSPLEEDIKFINPGTIISSKGTVESFYEYPKFITKYKITRSYISKLTNQLNQLVKLAVADNIGEGEKVCGLLSGGIDSTIITNIAKDLIKDFTVYTVGVNGSKDLFYANKYCKRFGLNHVKLTITLEEMLECLPEVIYALETFDAALIRSAIPMFLISKKIMMDQGECVLLTGEGADELFGGYSYIEKLNTNEMINNELLNLLRIEHKTGLQRVDRIPYFFSIEARAPLFDRRLVEFAFSIPPELKIFRKKGIGVAKKWIFRKAFENELPSEYIWRRKQKFSVGSGSQFLLRDYVEKLISNEEFSKEKDLLSNFSLRSKEELFYWRIFKKKFNPSLETISEIGLTGTFEV